MQLFKRIEKLPSAACQEDVCNMLCSKIGKVHVCLCQKHRKGRRAHPVLKDKEEKLSPSQCLDWLYKMDINFIIKTTGGEGREETQFSLFSFLCLLSFASLVH